VSTDYISPETIRNNISPSKLGEAQDRYALSVLIFQIFNKGVHPFQGIISDPNIDAATNDDKAAAGLYAYGVLPSTKIKAHPRSVHTKFPTSLLALFERAFTRVGLNRPSATEWKDYFVGLVVNKSLKRCSSFPKDPTHIHFKEGECIECFLNSLTNKTEWKSGHASSTPPVLPPVKPQKKTDYTLGFVLFGILLVIFLGWMSDRKTTTVPPVQQANSSQSTLEICRNYMSLCNNIDLCTIATTKQNGLQKWETSAVFKNHVLEAQLRGETCAVNQKEVATPQTCSSNPNLCNTYELCLKATRVVGGSKAWGTAGIGSKFVEEAKRRGETCGITNKSTQKCDSNPAFCSREELCVLATKITNSTKVWETSAVFKNHVLEAQLRGETCAVNQKEVATPQTCSSNPNLCNTYELCLKATRVVGGSKAWGTAGIGSKFVEEAKRRGETCGITNKSTQKCDSNPAFCSREELCVLATKITNSTKVWETSAVFKNHVLEAQLRGDTCAVGLASNRIDLIKDIQTELNRLGCNAGAVDGSAGLNTKKATALFSKQSNFRFSNEDFSSKVHLLQLRTKLRTIIGSSYCPSQTRANNNANKANIETPKRKKKNPIKTIINTVLCVGTAVASYGILPVCIEQ
jgi:hypothetical protein